MAINALNVIVGAPDQSNTVGAVNWADVGTSLPSDARTTLPATWKSGGYVSTDGVSLSIEQSTTPIDDWSLAHVRTLLDSFTGTVTFTFIQTDYDTLVMLFGASNVAQTPAAGSNGTLIKVSIGAELPPAKAFCFNMKDGDQRVRLALPNAQPTIDGELTFKANEPISWSVSLDCGADSTGKSIYFLYDNGVLASATTTTTGA